MKDKEAETAAARWAEAHQIYGQAVQHCANGQFSAALPKFEVAYAAARELSYVAAQAAARQDMGLCYEGLRETDKALQAFDESLALFQSVNENKGVEMVLHNLALTQRRIRDWQSAANSLDRIAEIAAGAGRPFDEATALNDAAVAFYEMIRPDEALIRLDKALITFRSMSRGPETADALAEALNNESLARQQRWELDEAITCLKEATELFREANNFRKLSIILSNLGAVYNKAGRPEDAIKVLTEALEVNELHPDKSAEAGALNNMALAHITMGQPQEALSCLNRSLLARRAAGDLIGEARTLISLGLVYREILYQPERALTYYQAAEKLLADTNNPQGLSVVLNNIGAVLRALGDPNRALPFLCRALAIKQSLRDLSGEAHVLANIATILTDCGRPAEALANFDKAITIEHRLKDHRAEAVSLIGLAWALVKLNRREDALKKFNEALELYRMVGDRIGRAMTLTRIGLVLHEAEQNTQAEQHFVAAIELFESIQATIVADEAKASYEAAMYDCYHGLTSVLVQRFQGAPQAINILHEAFSVVERGRARALQFMLSDAHSPLPHSVTTSLLDEDRNVRAQIDAIMHRSLGLQAKGLGPESTAETQLLEKRLSDLQEQLDHIGAQMREQNPSYKKAEKPPIASIEQTQIWLGKANAILFEYALGRTESYLFTIAKDGLQLHILPSEEQLTAQVSALLAALRDPGKKTYPYARELFETLILPAVDSIRGKQLLIAADGILNYLPFEALVGDALSDRTTSPSEPRQKSLSLPLPYLILQCTVRYIPSMTIMLALERQNQAKSDYGHQFVGIAPVNFSTSVNVSSATKEAISFPTLQHTEEEVRSICELFTRNAALGFLLKKATREAISSPEAAGARYLHIATHGSANEDRPAFSGLLLAPINDEDSGFISASDILRMRLRAEMVVLSACDTGLGKLSRGEGLLGLTRAFLYAGARSVVVSLWEVDDLATAELMKRFYQNLLGSPGIDKTDALRNAKVSMILNPPVVRGDKNHTAPYYWAPFVFVG